MSDSFASPWTVACQAPLSMGFPRQECWSGLPFPPPGDLPNPWIEPNLLHWQADSLLLRHLGSPERKIAYLKIWCWIKCVCVRFNHESSLQEHSYMCLQAKFIMNNDLLHHFICKVLSLCNQIGSLCSKKISHPFLKCSVVIVIG